MTSDGPDWTDIADWYDELLTQGSGPHEHGLWCLNELTPPVEGLDALDVACGQGIAARWLAAQGARVTGTDRSRGMLANAQRHGTPAGPTIRWVEEDAQTLAAFPDASFDLVTCQLALMDIPDLDAALASIHRVMRPGAAFVFVIGHPVFLVPGARFGVDQDGHHEVTLGGYLDERFWRSSNPEGVRRAGNHHRTFATYLTAFAEAGLHIVEAIEPPASGRLAEERAAYREIPMFLAGRAVRIDR